MAVLIKTRRILIEIWILTKAERNARISHYNWRVLSDTEILPHGVLTKLLQGILKQILVHWEVLAHSCCDAHVSPPSRHCGWSVCEEDFTHRCDLGRHSNTLVGKRCLHGGWLLSRHTGSLRARNILGCAHNRLINRFLLFARQLHIFWWFGSFRASDWVCLTFLKIVVGKHAVTASYRTFCFKCKCVRLIRM